jgi:hypothetical protein
VSEKLGHRVWRLKLKLPRVGWRVEGRDIPEFPNHDIQRKLGFPSEVEESPSDVRLKRVHER